MPLSSATAPRSTIQEANVRCGHDSGQPLNMFRVNLMLVFSTVDTLFWLRRSTVVFSRITTVV